MQQQLQFCTRAALRVLKTGVRATARACARRTIFAARGHGVLGRHHGEGAGWEMVSGNAKHGPPYLLQEGCHFLFTFNQWLHACTLWVELSRQRHRSPPPGSARGHQELPLDTLGPARDHVGGGAMARGSPTIQTAHRASKVGIQTLRALKG